MNRDVQLAFAPDATYAQLVSERATAHVGPLLGRIALAVAIIGTSVAIAATGRVSVELVTTVGVSWSFALLVQALAAAAIIVPARGRRVTTARAFELWFLAHVPWTLWFLVPAAVFSLTGIHFSDTVRFAGGAGAARVDDRRAAGVRPPGAGRQPRRRRRRRCTR